MASVLVFKLHGTAYGAYPDAHAILSLLHTAGCGDPDLRVSSLLPFVDGTLYLPLPTTALEVLDYLMGRRQGGAPAPRVPKSVVSQIKKGQIFVPSDTVGKVQQPEFWQGGSSFDAVVINSFKIPRNALDRVSSMSNLYFESGWYAERVRISIGGERERELLGQVREFAVVLDGDVDQDRIKTSLVGMPVGGNKTHGAVIVDVKTPEDFPRLSTNRSGGLLISIARPSDRPPKHVPVLYEKWVFYNDGTGVKRRAYSAYGAGSVLSEGEYTSGDVDAGKDVRGYTVKLFVRPLFVNLPETRWWEHAR